MKEESPTQKRKELFRLFLRLGFTSFGGPAAHIAMMQNEVVRKRNWLTNEEFLDLLSATYFIPGPNSTEMAIHIGRNQAGFSGLCMAGLSFILPAVAIVTTLAWVYVHFGSLPSTQKLLYGVEPVIMAVIAQALYSLGRSSLIHKKAVLAFLLVLALNVLGLSEVYCLFGIAALTYASEILRKKTPFLSSISLLSAAPFVSGATSVALSATVPFSFSSLFFFFLKTGSLLFGSGYVLISFLRTDLVERYHWLTESQLLTSISVGQFTPGPVFTTATFVGYLLGHGQGAFLATLGIFLPAFFWVAVTAPFLKKLKSSPLARSVLQSTNAASLALMAVASFYLGRHALVDARTAFIFLLSLFLLLRLKINSAYLVVGGALLGYFLCPI